jgi:hypothetical protein
MFCVTEAEAAAIRGAYEQGGYSLLSARTGEPVARLKPIPAARRFEVLWWRRRGFRS